MKVIYLKVIYIVIYLTNFFMLVLKWLKINCLMLYSLKNKFLVLSKYPHSDPHGYVPSIYCQCHQACVLCQQGTKQKR